MKKQKGKLLHRVVAITCAFLMLFTMLPMDMVVLAEGQEVVEDPAFVDGDTTVTFNVSFGNPDSLETINLKVEVEGEGDHYSTERRVERNESIELCLKNSINKYNVTFSADGYSKKTIPLTKEEGTTWDTEGDPVNLEKEIPTSAYTVKAYTGQYDGMMHPAVEVELHDSECKVTYSTNGKSYSEECPEFEIGELNVWVKISKEYYADTILKMKAKIAPTLITIERGAIQGRELVYNGEEQAAIEINLASQVENPIKITFSADGEKYSEKMPMVKTPGDYKFWVKLSRNNYEDTIVEVDTVVKPAEFEEKDIIIKPLAEFADGKEHELVQVEKQGSTADATVTYKITSVNIDSDEPFSSPDSSEVAPKGTIAGAYQIEVTYSKEHYEIVTKTVTAYLYKKVTSYFGFGSTIAEIAPEILTYNGTAQNLVNVKLINNDYNLYYCVDDSKSFSTFVNVIPTATDVPKNHKQEYTVYIAAVHKYGYDAAYGSVTVKMEKAVPTGFAFEDTNSEILTDFEVESETDANCYFTNKASFEGDKGNITYRIERVDAPANTFGGSQKEYDISSEGKVKVDKAGTYKIRATKEETRNYEAATIEYTLVVRPGEGRTITFENKLALLETVYTKDGKYTNNAELHYVDETMVYSIVAQYRDDVLVGEDDVPVATIVDSKTGKISINTAGRIRVQAYAPGDGKYEPSTGYYVLEIAKADQTKLYIDAVATGNQITYGCDTDIFLKEKDSTGDVSYTVDDTAKEYLTVENGKIKAIQAQGKDLKVYVTVAGDDCYNERTLEYTFETTQAEQKDFTFTNSIYNVPYGVTEFTVITKGSTSPESIVYSLDENNKDDIADIDPVTGKLTFKDGKVGSITINAYSEESQNYKAKTVSTQLNLQECNFSDKVTLVGTMGNGSWYRSNVTIQPEKGYAYLETNALQEEPKDNFVINTEGTHESKTFFLKELETSAISTAIQTGEIKIDKTAPQNVAVSYGEPKSVETINGKIYRYYRDWAEFSVTAFDDNSKVERIEVKVGDQTFEAKDSQLKGDGKKVTAYFKVPNECKEKIEVTVYDHAGNKTSLTEDSYIVVDQTEADVKVSYDNNNATNGNYYRANRTATIRVTEANFFAEDATIVVGKCGYGDAAFVETEVKPEFKKVAGTEDTYEAVIAFNENADYTFDISYTDHSGNKWDKYAKDAFTVDKQVPVVQVSFNNNLAHNGNFYNATRTATIKVTEHNFDPALAEVMVTAAKDEVPVAAPTLSGWSQDGDTYTATISFLEEALYTFDFSVSDKAGNAAADYAEQSFNIDLTSPEVSITGVQDQMAYTTDLAPAVSFSDRYLDMENVSIELVGANRGRVELEGTYSDITNGKSFQFKTFEDKQSVDDIYTLSVTATDMAGNTQSQSVQFSINRYGSTYVFGEYMKNLEGQFVQEITQDLAFAETNVSPLKNIEITLFKNSETLILKKGEDFEVNVTGGNNSWYKYNCAILKENFDEDGMYRISIYSEDEQGNVSVNTLDTKNKEISFAVDKTLPNVIVTNLEANTAYEVAEYTASVTANDNIKLKSVVAKLDGEEVGNWEGEDLDKTLNAGETLDVTIKENDGTPHKFEVVCTDMAGNVTETVVDGVIVTTNVRVINPDPIPGVAGIQMTPFIAVTGGVIALIVLAGIVIVLSQKKKQKKEA